MSNVRTRRCGLGIRPRHGKLRYWTPEQDALMGTGTVPELAKKFHRSLSAVYKRHGEPGIPIRRQSRWNPAAEALLGTMSDFKVAPKIKLNFSSVRKHRVKLGIRAFMRKPGKNRLTATEKSE